MTERKPCLPTCEPKPKTSPTLAALRKLAKRKGLTVHAYWFRRHNESCGYKHYGIDCGVMENGGMTVAVQTFNDDAEIGKAVAFAAISALPDKGEHR